LLKILVTRNNEANAALSTEISRLGYQCFCYPMFSYEDMNIDFSSLKYFNNLIVTSNLAAEIITKSIDYNIKAWVVGSKTLDTLSQNSYTQVISSSNNISSLELLLPDIYNRKNFIYYSGNDITQEIDNINRQIIYRTTYISNISEELLSLIVKVDVIMFYSYNNTKNFISLLLAQKSLHLLKSKKIITLSEKIALLFNDIGCDVYYSINNNNKEMLKILQWLKN